MCRAEELKGMALKTRRDILGMIYKAGSGHPGGSLSCVEILTVLYECVMNIRPEKPDWDGRDRFILSKGHAAPALYAVLAAKGYFGRGQLDTLRRLGSCLQGHPCMFKLPGIDMSAGSLGMGISVGTGMALAAKLKRKNYRVYVLCGDGELQEGQNWEAMMAAYKWKPDNLTIIIDHNHVQLDGANEDIMPMGDLAAKLSSFGMTVFKCDGHDVRDLAEAFKASGSCGGPAAIIAETVKGKGISFMEGRASWHGKQINEEDYTRAMAELGEGSL
jgi:transketolase